MKKLLFLLLVLFPAELAAQEVFYYRPENRPHLRYMDIWNQFDSSAVLFEFGEVSLHYNSAVHRIGMVDSIADYKKVQGTGAQGISTDLEQWARTENFTLTSGGVFQWFRSIDAFRTPCDVLIDTTAEGPNRPVSNWGLLDRTEFVVQLVRANNNEIIAVLDSVGVIPVTAYSGTDPRYGTRLSTVRHIAAVPAGYTGETVYIRVSPRRYGPTPLGMTMSPTPYWINRLALYDSTGTIMISGQEEKSLRERYFNEFIAYCDSARLATGWLPDHKGVTMSRQESTVFYSRYFTRQQNASGDYYIEIPSTNAKEPVLQSIENANRHRISPGAIIKEISPQPISTDEFTVSAYSVQKLEVRLRLLTLQGEDAGVLWSGAIEQGSTQIRVPTPHVAGGSYILIMEELTGEQISGRKILFAP